LTSSLYYADFGGGRSNLSNREVEILYLLAAVGSASEDLELTDELLREYKLAPPLEAEIVSGEFIQSSWN